MTNAIGWKKSATFGAVFRFMSLLAVVSLSTTVASAAIQPTFALDYSIWNATHIVLATEDESIDGELRVIESWKGDLEPDTIIALPALQHFAAKESRNVAGWDHTVLAEPYTRVVTGQQMVLFLVDSALNEPSASTAGNSVVWQPASQNGWSVSVAWIENGEAYTFQQVFNPGPSELRHFCTALEIRARVASHNAIQSGLEDAIHAQSPVLASQAVRAFTRENFHHGTKGAIEALANMGEVALPTLKTLLSTPSYHDPDVIAAMATAGGKNAGPDLILLVDEALAFWEDRGPELAADWWNHAPTDERQRLRVKYSRLIAALRALRPLQYEPCRQSVEKTQQLWARLPALNEVGNGQMVQACDDVLQSLAKKTSTL